ASARRAYSVRHEKTKSPLLPTFAPSPVHGGGLGWGGQQALNLTPMGQCPTNTMKLPRSSLEQISSFFFFGFDFQGLPCQ
ncbi:hypothetical protein L6R29_24180, partial [Myxococcota bacterium]|nr:hypothetical protein [Myxococcota bacterium]